MSSMQNFYSEDKMEYVNNYRNQNLPQDLEMEKALLGHIILSGEKSNQLLNEIVDKLQPEYFYDFNHRLLYKAILKLWIEEIPVDVSGLLVQLKKTDPKSVENINTEYILNLITKSSLIASISHTVKLLKEKYLLREVIALSEQIKALAFREELSASAILDLAQKKIYETATEQQDKNFVTIKEVIEQSFERFEKIQQGEESKNIISTGFIDLDKILGGLHKSDLIILAARPGMGKTSLALEIAKRVALRDQGVALFSLEMSAEQLCDRLIASESKVDFRRIRQADLSADEKNRDFEAIGLAIGRLGDCPIWIDDSGSLGILELRSKIRRLKSKQDIALIVIDYLQLMHSYNDRGYQTNRNQEVSEISRSLKILAKELNVPILALSQLSRSVENREDKRPMLSDLRESGSIEQDADIVLFIYREEFYNKNIDEQKRDIAELIISKHRNGETGKIELKWIRSLASFENLYQARISSRVEK